MDPNFYKFLFDNSSIGIYKSTLDGNLLEANPAFLDMLGYSNVDELILKVGNLRFLYKSPARRSKVINRLMNSEKLTYELVLVTLDGDDIFVRDNAVLSTDINGNRFIYGFVENLTGSYHISRHLRKSLIGSVKALSKMSEIRDYYTATHQRNVASLSLKICKRLGLGVDCRSCVYNASLLHDVGKIHIPSEILTKPARLNHLEFGMIKMHPEFGFEILKDISFDCKPNIAEVVLQHHERLDGSGYPNGLKEEDISRHAKIISVADVFDAMCSHRPYRPSLGSRSAIEELRKGTGIYYDPDVVQILMEILQEEGQLWSDFSY